MLVESSATAGASVALQGADRQAVAVSALPAVGAGDSAFVPPVHEWPAPAGSPPTQVAKVSPSPLLWHAWADTVVRHWESLWAQGAIDPAHPLQLLDLGKADETLAWAMPALLRARLKRSSCAGLRFQLLFRATDGSLPVALDGANPLVCLAWRVFEAFPSSYFAVCRGQIHAAVSGGIDTPPQWRRCRSPAGRPGALLRYYAARCGSAPLTLPLAACALIDEIADRCGGRYLLIGADGAVSTEACLRTHACGAGTMNLHALLLERRWSGATTWSSQPASSACVVYLVAGGGKDAVALDALAVLLEQGHPHRSEALAEAASCLQVGHVLTIAPVLLQSSLYDPAVLGACMAALMANSTVCERVAAQWRSVLARVWDNCRLPPACDGFFRNCAMLAGAVGDWGLARTMLEAGLRHYGDAPLDLQLLAHCESASGGLQRARRLLGRAVAMAPSDAVGAALLAAIERRLADAARMHGYFPLFASDGELCLEPLHPDHAQPLLFQYRDTGIAVMTGLPDLHTIAQVRQWIRAQRLKGGLGAYAVMHSRWGLVGMVFLRCCGRSAYFYFWIGCDFQGRGYGPRAARLLWTLARRGGIRHAYTSVYAGNLRSRGALERLGFVPLEIRAQAPDEELIFVYKPLNEGDRDSPHIVRHELRALCRALASPLRFVDYRPIARDALRWHPRPAPAPQCKQTHQRCHVMEDV